MRPDPPLDYLLDHATDPAPGRAELQAIVARAGRRRTIMAAAGMAATLLIGAIAGWSVADRTSRPASRVQVAATAAPAKPGPAGPAKVAPSAASPGRWTPSSYLSRVFARSTDGVTLRGFKVIRNQLPAGSPDCSKPLSPFVTEVSTEDMIANFGEVPFDTSVKLSGQVAVVGLFERAPVWVATAHAGVDVAMVRIRFSDGTSDHMAPVDGWAALAHPAPSGTTDAAVSATLEGIDQQGKVASTVQLGDGKFALTQPTAPGCTSDAFNQAAKKAMAQPPGMTPTK